MPDMVSQLVFLLKSAHDTRIEVQVGFGGRKSQKALFGMQNEIGKSVRTIKNDPSRDSLTNSIESTSNLSH